jgi:hypothetical protein
MRKTRNSTYIYALTVPGHPEAVRYVGTTKHRDFLNSFRKHPTTLNSPVMRWYRRLRALGLVPGVILLSRVPSEAVTERKAIWVELFLEDGQPLYNAPSRKPRKGRAVETFHATRLFEQCISRKVPKRRKPRSLATLRSLYYKRLDLKAGREASAITLEMPSFHTHEPEPIASPHWLDMHTVPQSDLWP